MGPSIATKLTGQVTRPVRSERRASKRHVPATLTPCQLTTSEGEPVDSALVHDLSTTGAGILTEQGIKPGSVVSLLLVNSNHTFALSVDYEVLRCTCSPAGTYFLGGRFARPLTHDEMVPFLV